MGLNTDLDSIMNWWFVSDEIACAIEHASPLEPATATLIAVVNVLEKISSGIERDALET